MSFDPSKVWERKPECAYQKQSPQAHPLGLYEIGGDMSFRTIYVPWPVHVHGVEHRYWLIQRELLRRPHQIW
jgi:hypothetical protein